MGAMTQQPVRWRQSVAPLTWARGLVIVGLFVAAVLVAKTCQQAQVRVTQDGAIATARKRIDFTPTRTQIRLVRQGINSRPFWAVSFSIPKRDRSGYDRVATVRVDANSGKVAAVNSPKGAQPASP